MIFKTYYWDLSGECEIINYNIKWDDKEFKKYISKSLDLSLVKNLKMGSTIIFLIIFLSSLVFLTIYSLGRSISIFGDTKSIVSSNLYISTFLSFTSLLISFKINLDFKKKTANLNIDNKNKNNVNDSKLNSFKFNNSKSNTFFNRFYNEKFMDYLIKLIFLIIFVFLVIFVLYFFNFLFGSSLFEISYIGFIMVLMYSFSLYAIYFNKFLKAYQLVSLLLLIVGYAGFLFYFGYDIKYNLSFGFLLYGLLFGLGLLFMLPERAYIKNLCLNNSSGKFVRIVLYIVPLTLAIVSTALIYINKLVTYQLPRGLLASFAMILLFMIIFFYSNRISLDAYDEEISNRKTTGKELFYEDVIKHMVEGIIVINKDNKITYINDYFSDSFPITDDFKIGADFKNSYVYTLFKKEFLQSSEELSSVSIDSKLISYDNLFYLIKKNNANNNLNHEFDFDNLFEDKYVSGWIIPKVENGSFKGVVCTMVNVTDDQKHVSGLRSSIMEKNILLSEVHHRVKTNLQIIQSLLNLEYHYTSNSELKKVLRESQCKIVSMALVHENLYQSDKFQLVNMKSYINGLIKQLKTTYSKVDSNIKFKHKVLEISLNSDIVISLGLIINELITNSVKYAFPNSEPGSIIVEFNKIVDEYILIVRDNGVGFDKTNQKKGSGTGLVESLVLQIEGSIDVDVSNGTQTTIKFKDKGN